MRSRRDLTIELAAWKRTAECYEQVIEGLRIEINRMTPAYLDSPHCLKHDSIASIQQVKGGAFTWMEYCNFKTKHECDVYPKVGR